jgi:hypothetical protein
VHINPFDGAVFPDPGISFAAFVQTAKSDLGMLHQCPVFHASALEFSFISNPMFG